MSLPNPNKTVTEQRLQEFYTQILPYLGGMPEAVCNKFSKSDLYSTDEIIVGSWKGKPKYQKIFNIGALDNDGSRKIYAHNIANFESMVYVTGFAVTNDVGNVLIPSYYMVNNEDSGAIKSISIRVTNTNIILGAKWSNHTITDSYVLIQYTKTTDAANSFKWGDENDYSLDEKIVGTDENGEYIYQKTFSIGSFSGTNKTVAHNISNFDRCVKATMHLLNSNNNSWSTGGTTFYNGTNNWCSVGTDNTNIYIYMGSSMNWVTGCKVTLQYTKTT